MRDKVVGKGGFVSEQFLAGLAGPFSAMVLEFVGEPFVPASEHSEVALFESADIWFQVSKDMFPDGASVQLKCFPLL